MKRQDRPIIVAALNERLPPGWHAKETGQFVTVTGPPCDEEPGRNTWCVGTGAPVYYPAGLNYISRLECNPGYDSGFHHTHARFYGRGWRDLIIAKMVEIANDPPLSRKQRAKVTR